MPFDVKLSPTALRAIDAVDEAARIARDTRDRLSDLAARARRVVDDSDWNAPSAQAFHERLESWRMLLSTAQTRAEDVADSLARARADIQARAWAELS